MNADGTGRTRLTDGPDDAWPVWSPDGTRIAFTRYVDIDSAEIYVMDADGSNQVNLTNNPSNDFAPAGPPTGRASRLPEAPARTQTST